jgi:hypothetical protein
MLRIAVLAAVAMVLIGIVAKAAEARPRCGSGTTAFVEGKLRIFGISFDRPDTFGGREFGFDAYACLGGRGKPVSVGGRYDNTGTASADTPAYAYDGRRYLAAYDTDDGEGGPSAHLSVLDLRTGRWSAFTNAACCENVPAFRVAHDGSLVANTPGEGLFVKRPGHRARTLSLDAPVDLAMRGETVYWTSRGVAHSIVLDGAGAGAEALMLEPVRVDGRPGCAGRAIAAAGSVRILKRGARRVGCRIGGPHRFPAGVAGDPRPRIVSGRWVLLRAGDTARVVDSRTGKVVARAGEVSQSTVLRDGTLAWIDTTGRLITRRPGFGPSLVADGATALAAARRAVYWTRDGVPQVFRPGRVQEASAARSASKPG